MRRLRFSPKDIEGARFVVGKGCSRCDYTGYKGRIGIFELLVLNESVKDAILSRKTSYEIRRISMESSGLVTLLESGIVKAGLGQTTVSEILRHLPKLEIARSFSDLRRLVGV